MNKQFDIPKFKRRNWSKVISTPRAIATLMRRGHDGGNEIFPSVKSDDANFLRLCEQLMFALSKEFEVTINQDGSCGANGVVSLFTKLMTVSGYRMHPTSIPAHSNVAMRHALGLNAESFKTPRHELIATQLFQTMFGAARPSRLSIRREASMGAPNFVADLKLKHRHFLHAAHNLDHVLSLIEQGNLTALLIEYCAPIVQFIGERQQPDALKGDDVHHLKPKERLVNSEAYARGLSSDGRFAADKSVVKDGVSIADHFAMRARNVYGMAFVINHLDAAIMSQFREYYLNEFEFTWKHRGHDHVTEKIANWKYFAGFDVTSFDSTVPKFILDWLCEQFATVLDDRIVKMKKLMVHAPYIMPCPSNLPHDIIVTDPFHGDDPLDTDCFNFDLGLPSGIASNPDYGKFIMMFQYLCLIDDIEHDVIEFGIPEILKGNHPKYAFLNAGDDCVILMNDESLAARIRDGDYTSDYFKVEPEMPISFLGGVIADCGSEGHKVVPNIESYFANWLVPEKGIDHHTRKNFWAVGEHERRMYYSAAPAFPLAQTIYQELCIKHLGRSPAALVGDSYERQAPQLGLSAIDMLVLQNPAYLHYRYSEEQVSQNILDIIVTAISPETIVPLFQPFFKIKIGE